ncbi:hypothetical protein CEXT_511011 [Caerostris extrusa]|uniref:Uncharacterized protein n=1 Tax=Caerostris extrusa TaxID=172846 RepID=A0AAV4XH54_CAEEX|nr:hypothetical protein CEXT_511011 [Caerostris extrusa]
MELSKSNRVLAVWPHYKCIVPYRNAFKIGEKKLIWILLSQFLAWVAFSPQRDDGIHYVSLFITSKKEKFFTGFLLELYSLKYLLSYTNPYLYAIYWHDSPPNQTGKK